MGTANTQQQAPQPVRPYLDQQRTLARHLAELCPCDPSKKSALPGFVISPAAMALLQRADELYCDGEEGEAAQMLQNFSDLLRKEIFEFIQPLVKQPLVKLLQMKKDADIAFEKYGGEALQQFRAQFTERQQHLSRQLTSQDGDIWNKLAKLGELFQFVAEAPEQLTALVCCRKDERRPQQQVSSAPLREVLAHMTAVASLPAQVSQLSAG